MATTNTEKLNKAALSEPSAPHYLGLGGLVVSHLRLGYFCKLMMMIFIVMVNTSLESKLKVVDLSCSTLLIMIQK